MRYEDVSPGDGPGLGGGGRGHGRVGRSRVCYWARGRLALFLTAAVASACLLDLVGPPDDLPTRRVSGGRGPTIWRLVFSPDGQTIAAVDEKLGLRLQPAAEGRGLARELRVHGLVNAVAFSPDGRYLAVGGIGPDVVLCDLIEGGPDRRLGIPVSKPSCLGFSPDGRTLAVAGIAPPEMILWDIEAGRPRMTLRADSGPVTHIAFGPDGRSLTSVSSPNGAPGHIPAVLIWDLATGRRRARLKASPGITCAFSPDGRLLAIAGSGQGGVELQELPSGRPIGPIIATPGPVYAMAVSPDARLLATVIAGHLVSVWSLATGRELCRLDNQAETLHCVAFAPDGTTVFGAGSEGNIRLWDLRRAIVDAATGIGPS